MSAQDLAPIYENDGLAVKLPPPLSDPSNITI